MPFLLPDKGPRYLIQIPCHNHRWYLPTTLKMETTTTPGPLHKLLQLPPPQPCQSVWNSNPSPHTQQNAISATAATTPECPAAHPAAGNRVTHAPSLMDARGPIMPEVVFILVRLSGVSWSRWRLRLRLRRGVELGNRLGLSRGRGRKKRGKEEEEERMVGLRLDQLGGLSDSSVRGVNGRGRVVVRRVTVLMLMLPVPVHHVLHLLTMEGHHHPLAPRMI